MRRISAVLTVLALALAGALLATWPSSSAATLPQGELGFDVGGVPHGSNGASCNTGSADGPDSAADQYSSVQEMGNTNCSSSVAFQTTHLRTPDSTKSLKIVIGPNQQREALVSKFSWTPDASGSVDQWYGWSMFFDSDWKLSELAGSWDDPISWRTQGPNGSLNFSIDHNSTGDNSKPQTTYATPHFSLRRNTVRNQQGFYKDGLGLDKIDMGPVEVGKWMDFVCHIRWSTTATNALRECWRGSPGQPMTDMGKRTSLNAVDTRVHNLRVEQYQDTNIGHARTSYYDNVRIGDSFASVDPQRGSASPTDTATPTVTMSPLPNVPNAPSSSATDTTSSSSSSSPSDLPSSTGPAAPAGPAQGPAHELLCPIVSSPMVGQTVTCTFQ